MIVNGKLFTLRYFLSVHHGRCRGECHSGTFTRLIHGIAPQAWIMNYRISFSVRTPCHLLGIQ